MKRRKGNCVRRMSRILPRPSNYISVFTSKCVKCGHRFEYPVGKPNRDLALAGLINICNCCMP